jgi:hypothetical protein
MSLSTPRHACTRRSQLAACTSLWRSEPHILGQRTTLQLVEYMRAGMHLLSDPVKLPSPKATRTQVAIQCRSIGRLIDRTGVPLCTYKFLGLASTSPFSERWSLNLPISIISKQRRAYLTLIDLATAHGGGASLHVTSRYE